jgi:hypothetical protein
MADGNLVTLSSIEGSNTSVSVGCVSAEISLIAVKTEVLYYFNFNTRIVNTLLEVLIIPESEFKRRLLVLWNPVD